MPLKTYESPLSPACTSGLQLAGNDPMAQIGLLVVKIPSAIASVVLA
jgi:hypothetical protein